MGDLRRQRDLDGEDPDRRREVPAGGVAPLVEGVGPQDLGAEAAEGDRLPVLGEHPVAGRVEGRDGPGDDGLLAFDRGVGARPALALEGEEPAVGHPGLDHLGHDGDQILVGDGGRVGHEFRPVFGKDPVDGLGGGQLEVEAHPTLTRR